VRVFLVKCHVFQGLGGVFFGTNRTHYGVLRVRLFSCCINNLNTMAMIPKGVDVVGCDKESDGRSCTAHRVCGHFVKAGDKLYCKFEVQQFEDDNEGEACVQVHKLGAGGEISCHVGYLQRRIVKSSRDDLGNKDGGKSYDGMWLTAIADLRLSDSSVERARSTRNGGLFYCQVLQNDARFVGVNPFNTPIVDVEEVANEEEAEENN
jgi:hypothetical protein